MSTAASALGLRPPLSTARGSTDTRSDRGARGATAVRCAAMILVVLFLGGCFHYGATSGSQARSINYSFRSGINVNTGDPQGWTLKAIVEVWTNDGRYVQPGWMGGSARIYTKSGHLCPGSGDDYSVTSRKSWSAELWSGIDARCPGTDFFAKGRAYLYRGGSGDPYARYSTYATKYDR